MENDGMNNMMELMNKRAASDMLEDALQHFDDIIDSTANVNHGDERISDDDLDVENDLESGLRGVALLMEDLRNAIEATLDAEVNDEDERNVFHEALLKHLSLDTLSFYRKLLQIQPRNESESDQVNRLQIENESLSLHVSVLTDQVELQTDKISELELQYKEALQRLEGADARLQEEVATKTTLETQKLQLMNEMSNYKIDLAQRQQQLKIDEGDLILAEKQRIETEARTDQYKFLMVKLNSMKDKVLNVQQEKMDFSNRLSAQQQMVESLQRNIIDKDKLLEELQRQIQLSKLQTAAAPKITSPDEGIVQDHDEKENRLLQLRMPAPFATSTPISNEQDGKLHGPQTVKGNTDSHDVSSSSSTPTRPHTSRSQSLEKLHAVRVDQGKTEATLMDEGTLQSKHMGGSSRALPSPTTPPANNKPNTSWQSTKSPKTKSSSTPNLAMTEVQPPLVHEERNETPTRSNHSPFHHRKKHGFRKFFSSFKLRRSRSTSLEAGAMTAEALSTNKRDNNFQRGGVRSTAGPRLGWNTRDHSNQMKITHNDNTPFQRWDTERVCQWLADIGLNAYIDACRKWVKSGDTLLRATNHELERELGVRHSLHKKKLMLHLQALGGDDEEDIAGAAQMNSVWVARWLDDVGLPQYKDAFHEACIDGRTLHHLTVSDAQKLKITNLFHLISLKRAIEMLRTCQFDPTQLKRRPVNEGETEDVNLWTNHRVMEWLRHADLAEYAPNLRGSGVHGALMVLEPLFNAETLASLLHIPLSKSLLRRHLAAKLDELLPVESNCLKKERAQEPGFQQLNVTIKYKLGRRSFGGLGRLRGSSAGSAVREFGSGEYVCPMSSSAKSKTMAGHRTDLEKKMQIEGMKDKRSVEAMKDEDEPASDNIEVVELNESTTREINAFSAQINTLTSNWKED